MACWRHELHMRLAKALFVLLGFCCPVAAQQSAVYIEPSHDLIRQTVQVAAGRALQYNFTLVRGSTLTAQFQVSGGANNQIRVWLLDAPNYQRYLAHQQYVYFPGTAGSVRQAAKYTFRVPQTSIYFLVLDNSGAWLLPRTVHLYVYAILTEPTTEQVELQNQLNAGYQGIKRLFIFDDFRISIRHCGVENAFSNPDITICTELVATLHDQNLDEAVAFVLFHELGHTLLRLWNYPLWDNEDAADEFATTILILGKKKEMALKAAQWWASQTSEKEALSKLWMDDRHSVSPQRARNIIRWLNQEDELVRRWLRILVPNMQTQALVSMRDDPDPRLDKNLIRAEIERRQASKPQDH
jgi:hypothetical protein